MFDWLKRPLGRRDGLVPVHMTVLDSSEKVLMSRGLAEDRGDWGPPALDSTGFFWKDEVRDTNDTTMLTNTLILNKDTHTADTH